MTVVADESPLDFVLGFFGEQEVATANAAALLNDLIAAHKKTNRTGTVRFIIPVEPLTETLENLAELCLNSGHKLELIGHERPLQDPKVVRYAEDADMVIEVPFEMTIAAALVERVHAPLHGRVILLADPSEDDGAYFVLEKASEKFIIVRSLLNGLEMVTLYQPETAEQDKETSEVVKRARSEEPDEDELEDEEEDEEEEEYEDVDDDDLEDEEDDLEDEDEEDEEDDEPEPAPRKKRRPAPVEEDEEDDEPDDDEDEDEDEEDEPAPPPRRKKPAVKAPAKKAAPTSKAKPSSDTTYTRDELEELERDDLYDVASGFGIGPAKGRKLSTVVNMILEEQDGGATPKAAPAAKKPAAAPAKKASAPAASKPTREVPVPSGEISATLLSSGFGMERVVKVTMKHVGQALINASEEL